jgi:hypothetical protein
MTGLVGTGQAYQDQAMYGLEQAADLEERRNMQTRRNKTSRVQSEASLAGTGAAIGTQIAPGWGTVIGGAAGLLAGALM